VGKLSTENKTLEKKIEDLTSPKPKKGQSGKKNMINDDLIFLNKRENIEQEEHGQAKIISAQMQKNISAKGSAKNSGSKKLKVDSKVQQITKP
jgi:hypothetical protein